MTSQQKQTGLTSNPYEIMQQLKTGKLLIHSIPNETWELFCTRDKRLLVDIYTISGQIGGRKQTYRCGRLGEILLRMLRHHKMHYHGFTPYEDGVTSFTRSSVRLADTLEEDALIRLRNGDIIFYATGDPWRLTSTCFGMFQHSGMLYLAKESTVGTPDLQVYEGIELAPVLLEFLCQKAEFVETKTTKVLAFKPSETTP